MRLSEARYRDLFENMVQGAFYQRADGSFVEVNQAALRIFGLSREEFLSRTSQTPSWDVISESGERVPAGQYPSTLALATGRPVPSRVLGVRNEQTGERRWVEIGAVPEFRTGDPKPHLVMVTMHDITQHKVTDQALRESEERFKSAFVHSPIGMALVAPDGRWIAVNASVSAIVGYTEAELLAGRFQDITHPDDLEADLRFVQQMLAGERVTYRMEKRYIHKDGHVVRVLLAVTLIRDALGAPAYFISQIEDITERWRAEQQLAQSNQILSVVVKHTPMMLVLLDTRFDFVWVNQAYADTCGKPPSFFPGKNHFALYPNEENQRIFERVVETGQPFFVAAKVFVFPDQPERGETYWDWSLAPIKDGQDRVTGLVFSLTEVTERVKTAEAQQASEARHQALLQTAMDGFWLVGLDGRLLEVNDTYCRMSGYSEQELVGKHASELDADESAAATLAHVEKVMSQGEDRFLARHRRKDGTQFDVEVSVQYRAEAGGTLVAFLRDVSEKKRADEALRKSESRHAKMVANLGDVIAVIDRQGINRYKSPNLERWFGWKPEELVGRSAFDQVHPEDLAKAREFFGRLVEQPEATSSLECRYRCKDGSYKWIEFMGANLLADPEIAGILGNYRDISERKQMEEQYRTLFREMLDGFALHQIVCDDQGRPCDYRFLAVNPAFERMTGLKGTEIVGRRATEVMPQLERHWIDTYGKVALTGSPSFFENYSADLGKNFEVTAFRPLPGQFACIFADITQRKRAEEAMQESNRRLQLAVKSGRMGVWDWDLQRKTMVWDDQMLALYGLTREQFPGGVEAWNQGLHPEDRERALAECQAALDGTRDFDTEFRVVQPGGDVRHVKANGLVLRDEQGAAVRMLGLNWDVTHRRQAEEQAARLEAQLQQAHKMESVGRLAGGVAHDFNNMLGVILGHVELALEQLDPAQPLHSDLREIQTAARRSAELTRQLLAFARKQTVMPKVLDLNATVVGMLKMLQRLIGEDLHLDWKPETGLWPIKMDPSQVDQLLANLCVNARDAIEGGGTITIETANCTLRAGDCAALPGSAPGDYVRLVVSDDGRGMDAETMSHLFEPFFTTKEMGKGTGLGLATVYGIVKQNQGLLDVRSEPGRGTTFRLYLPRFTGAAEAEAGAGAQVATQGRETILVVEDEAGLLRLIERTLGQRGYTVLTATSPGAALALAKRHPGAVHLLVTDVVMPEMNGRDLAGALAQVFPGMKKLYMSGYTADVIAHHGVLDEGVEFLQKPFLGPDLAAKVRAVLDAT